MSRAAHLNVDKVAVAQVDVEEQAGGLAGPEGQSVVPGRVDGRELGRVAQVAGPLQAARGLDGCMRKKKVL